MQQSESTTLARVVAGIVASMFLAACGPESAPVPQAESATRRVLSSGELVGFHGDYGSDAWLGIPFAKPPVGELRWRAPQPPEQWTGVRPALTHGALCPQFASSLGGSKAKEGTPIGNEDCLFLSVWTPRFSGGTVPSGDARLPVMVWIHGGGNTVGHGSFYDGGALAAKENVVVVTINYRLGPFGWFHNAALAGDNKLDASGNYGTLDIIRALHWVHDNIAAFGGNPDNVTIFGESAGGSNVFTMLLSPEAHGLFHRAIVESGGLDFTTPAAGENVTEQGGDRNSSSEILLRLLVTDGKAKDRAAAQQIAAAMSPVATAAYLRGKSRDEILNAYGVQPGFGMIDMPCVFADGTVIPSDNPLTLFARAGGYNAVPVMLGTNHDENKLFMFGDPRLVYRILWIAPRLRDERMYNLSADYAAKMWKARGADEPAAALRTTQPDVFVYRFDWDEEPSLLGADLSVMLGAAHFFEVPFVFGNFDMAGELQRLFTTQNAPGRMQLSDAMMSYWTAFAYNGAPASGRTQNLKAWTAAPQFMVLDTEAGGGLRLSSDTVTRASVIAAVDADPRLAAPKDRCAILHDLAMWSRGYTKQEYAARADCRAFPFDTYPWA